MNLINKGIHRCGQWEYKDLGERHLCFRLSPCDPFQTQGKKKLTLSKARMLKVENKGILELIQTELALIILGNQYTDMIKFIETAYISASQLTVYLAMPYYWGDTTFNGKNFTHIDSKITSQV